MSLADDLETLLVDNFYQNTLKPRLPEAAAAMRAQAPARSGSLQAATGCTLGKASNNNQAVVWFYSNPSELPVYPGHSRNRRLASGASVSRTDAGSHANFSNARGSSKGWWDRAVKAGAGVILGQ